MTATAKPAPFDSRAPKLGLVGSFDGIRGVGVCMVLVGHALFTYFESWVTIVDTFFVLSAFLITTLLLQEHRSNHRIDLRKFYQRRAIRLLPSVLLFVGVWLVISTVATLVGYEALSLRYVAADGLAAVTYMYHLVFPNGLYMIDPAAQSHRTMWHLWTLSVEEWFYAVIAGTVLICVRKRWIVQLATVMIVLFVAIAVARWYAYTGFFQDDDSMIAGVRLAFLQRPDALLLGVAIACVNAHMTEERVQRIRRPMMVAGTLAFLLWFAMLNLSSGFVEKLGLPYFDYLPAKPSEFTRPQMLDHMYWFRFGHSLGALGFGVMVFCMCRYSRWWFGRIMEWRPFQWMGRMSYTLYVWHALPYLLIFSLTGGENASLTVSILRTPVLIASAFAVSWPVYRYVELRVLRTKIRFSAERETLDLTTGKMVQVNGTGPASGDVPAGAAGAGSESDTSPERAGASGGPEAPVG